MISLSAGRLPTGCAILSQVLVTLLQLEDGNTALTESQEDAGAPALAAYVRSLTEPRSDDECQVSCRGLLKESLTWSRQPGHCTLCCACALHVLIDNNSVLAAAGISHAAG